MKALKAVFASLVLVLNIFFHISLLLPFALIKLVLPFRPVRRVVDAVLNAYPDWKIPGSVIAIVPTADRSKATVKVRIALDAKDTRIVPDMGVRVGFLEAAKPAETNARPGVLVPAAAITAPSARVWRVF